eukprot:scaffold41673_cov22-Tisochrysis_lutea.AAC.2
MSAHSGRGCTTAVHAAACSGSRLCSTPVQYQHHPWACPGPAPATCYQHSTQHSACERIRVSLRHPPAGKLRPLTSYEPQNQVHHHTSKPIHPWASPGLQASPGLGRASYRTADGGRNRICLTAKDACTRAHTHTDTHTKGSNPPVSDSCQPAGPPGPCTGCVQMAPAQQHGCSAVCGLGRKGWQGLPGLQRWATFKEAGKSFQACRFPV